MDLPAIDPREVDPIVSACVARADQIRAELGGSGDTALVGKFEDYLEKGRGIVALLVKSELAAARLDPIVDGAFRGIGLTCKGRIDAYQGGDALALTPEQQRELVLAAACQAIFIGEDMRWLKLPFIYEWREGNRRLMLLDHKLEGHDLSLRAALIELGLANALARLETVFVAYGSALGILRDGHNLGPKLEDWQAALEDLLFAIRGKFGKKAGAHTRSGIIEPVDQALQRQRERRRTTSASGASTSPSTTT